VVEPVETSGVGLDKLDHRKMLDHRNRLDHREMLDHDPMSSIAELIGWPIQTGNGIRR